MALKDDIAASLAASTTKAKALKDVEAALRADATAKDEAASKMLARIAELEAMPGNWTDADVAEIKGSLEALSTSLDPDTTVTTVLSNTDNPPA